MNGLELDGKLSGTRLIEGAFAEDETLTEVVLPDYIEDIGEVAFYGCVNLRRIVLPEGLKVIREEAFGESGLTEVRIPERTELICEKAFFSCEELARIEVPSARTVIGPDAFGFCPKLLEGYAACGYPENANPPEELLFTLLWCSCPERHTEETSARAKAFIRKNENLIMERIFKSGNTAAMSGLARQHLLRPENISRYVETANANRQTELVVLLLDAAERPAAAGQKQQGTVWDLAAGEFDL